MMARPRTSGGRRTLLALLLLERVDIHMRPGYQTRRVAEFAVKLEVDNLSVLKLLKGLS